MQNQHLNASSSQTILNRPLKSTEWTRVGKGLFLSLLVQLIFSCSVVSQEKEDAEIDLRIQRIENGLMRSLQIEGEEIITYNIEERLKQLGIPGVSIAFATNGKLEWARAYGMADIIDDRPMDTETMLLAGSISKPVAAIRGLQLADEGKLDLDKNVNEYLSSWKLPENEFTKSEKVTLRRILNHTAGLTVWGFSGYYNGAYLPTVIDILSGRGNSPKLEVYKQPGESWQYSGGGYTLMQLMITDLDGTTFPETMRENIFIPLGMKKSTFQNPLPKKYHPIAATGYRENGYEVGGKWPIYPEMAAAGLWTTPSELIEYALEVQRIYNTKQDGILTFESTSEMLTPGLNGHGLGPMIDDLTFFHEGDDQGFKARLKAWKDGSHAVVIMVNSDNASIIEEVLLAIANEYELAGVQPNMIQIVKISKDDLKKYTGRYQVQNLGVLEVKISGSQLVLEAPFLGGTVPLIAGSHTTFYDKVNGIKIEFTLDGNKVDKFSVQDLLTAKRVK